MGILALAQVASIVATYVVLGLAFGSSLIHGGSAEVFGVGAMWIVLGYVLYSTAYAAAGSLVGRRSDAYLRLPAVQLPLILSYLLTFTVLFGNSVYAFYWFLAFFPPTAPISMTALVAISVARPWEIALSALSSVWRPPRAWPGWPARYMVARSSTRRPPAPAPGAAPRGWIKHHAVAGARAPACHGDGSV